MGLERVGLFPVASAAVAEIRFPFLNAVDEYRELR